MPNSVEMYHMFYLASLPHASFAFAADINTPLEETMPIFFSHSGDTDKTKFCTRAQDSYTGILVTRTKQNFVHVHRIVTLVCTKSFG